MRCARHRHVHTDVQAQGDDAFKSKEYTIYTHIRTIVVLILKIICCSQSKEQLAGLPTALAVALEHAHAGVEHIAGADPR